MLEHLCGPIAALSAEFTDARTTMALSLRFASGAVGSLVGSYDTSYAYPDTQRIEVSGTKGRVVIDDTVRRYRFNAAGNELGETWEAGYFNDLDREFHRTFDRYIDATLEAFKQGEPPPGPRPRRSSRPPTRPRRHRVDRDRAAGRDARATPLVSIGPIGL